MLKNQKGFTLIEILVVIAIIGLLLIYLVPQLDSITNNSKINVVETDFRTMKTGIQQHFIDNRSQDFTEKEIKEYLDFGFELYETGAVDKYKTTIKKDPWGSPYYMFVKNKGNRYVLLQSYGPDEKKSVQGNNFGDDVVFIYYPKNN